MKTKTDTQLPSMTWAERMSRMMLEDLNTKLNEFGENSEQYLKQQKTAQTTLKGSLIEILDAAIAHWDQNRCKQNQTTQIDQL